MSSIKKITFIFLFIEKLFDNNFNILRKKGKKKKRIGVLQNWFQIVPTSTIISNWTYTNKGKIILTDDEA